MSFEDVFQHAQENRATKPLPNSFVSFWDFDIIGRFLISWIVDISGKVSSAYFSLISSFPYEDVSEVLRFFNVI